MILCFLGIQNQENMHATTIIYSMTFDARYRCCHLLRTTTSWEFFGNFNRKVDIDIFCQIHTNVSIDMAMSLEKKRI